MAQFSTNMRKVANDLCKELGNACVLSQVTTGSYDPALGKSPVIKTDFATYSAQDKRLSQQFGLGGNNTNLEGFSNEDILVPWFGYEIDTTWQYNGQNITSVSDLKAQDDIIVFNISVGAKDG